MTSTVPSGRARTNLDILEEGWSNILGRCDLCCFWTICNCLEFWFRFEFWFWHLLFDFLLKSEYKNLKSWVSNSSYNWLKCYGLYSAIYLVLPSSPDNLPKCLLLSSRVFSHVLFVHQIGRTLWHKAGKCMVFLLYDTSYEFSNDLFG